jgi:hypothetical protein
MPTRGGRHRPKTRVIMSKDWSLRATLQPIYISGRECIEVILWTKYQQDTGKWIKLRRWVLPHTVSMEKAMETVQRTLIDEEEIKQ